MRVELARMKARGLDFEYAWKVAFEQRISWPHDKEIRNEWKAVLESQLTNWRDCYEDRGTPLNIERIIDALARESDMDEPGDEPAIAYAA